MTAPDARNRRLFGGLALVVVGMVGLAYASVPLYRLFCQVTGFGGTTQRAEVTTVEPGERVVTVRFDANVNPRLPWRFRPGEREVEVRVGEERLSFYEAQNISARPVTGTALFNVTPHKAGQYFVKVACFCFDEQLLEPGQRIDMPVSFYVDPAIGEDRNMDDVQTITLSYTFFPADQPQDGGTQVSALDRGGAAD